MTYVGKYDKSRKAVDLELENLNNNGEFFECMQRLKKQKKLYFK